MATQYSVKAGDLTLNIHTSAEAAFAVNSILISGKHEAILVDAQFTASEAKAVADMTDKVLKQGGQKLLYIYVTHCHPDHYFGLDVLGERFPQAKIVAMPKVCERMKVQGPQKIEQWKHLGPEAPKKLIDPQPLSSPEFKIDGHQISLLGPMVGDTEDQYPLWIPSSSTLIAGDLLYCNSHLWTLEADPKNRKHWLEAIDKLMALKPKIVIAGHQKPNGPTDISILSVCREYLIAFDEEIKKCTTSDQLIAAMKAKYPNFNLDICLSYGAQAQAGSKSCCPGH
jgi:glyoxylase-like metal-dependent hydrolase (beta-lactamase superfamily II)